MFNGYFKWLIILNRLGLFHHVVYFIMSSNLKNGNEDLFIIFQIVNFQKWGILRECISVNLNVRGEYVS